MQTTKNNDYVGYTQVNICIKRFRILPFDLFSLLLLFKTSADKYTGKHKLCYRKINSKQASKSQRKQNYRNSSKMLIDCFLLIHMTKYMRTSCHLFPIVFASLKFLI